MNAMLSQYMACIILLVCFMLLRRFGVDPIGIYGGRSVANGSLRKNGRSTWRRRRPLGSMPAIIALVGAAVILAAYLIQSSALSGMGTRAAANGGLRISEVMSSNASTRLQDGAGFVDWIELRILLIR